MKVDVLIAVAEKGGVEKVINDVLSLGKICGMINTGNKVKEIIRISDIY